MYQDNNKNTFLVYLYRIEDIIVSLLLSFIIIFSLYQIILRNFFDSGYVWGESLLRILVLWLGLVGAILASRKGKQISIDVLSQFIPDNYKNFIRKLNFLFAALICLIISYYSMKFVNLEYQDGTIAFEMVPAWLTESIIPLGFFIMGIRYLAQIIYDKKS